MVNLIVKILLMNIKEVLKPYEDIEILRMEEYPISTFDKDKKVIKDAWKIDLKCKK